jgi:putative ABC transport system permease protein
MVLTESVEPGYLFLLGVNFQDFQTLFPDTMDVLEGDFLGPGDRGLLVPQSTRKQMYDYNGFWLVAENGTLNEEYLTDEALEQKDTLTIKDHMVVMGFSGDGLESDILAPVQGVIRFKNLDDIWDGLAFIDLESSREAFGYVTAADSAIELTSDQEAALEMDDLEDLFGEGDLVEETDTTEVAYDLEAMQQQTERVETEIDLDSGAYNMVIVKLNPGTPLEEGKKWLQQAFADSGVPAKVVDWKQASGEVAQLVTISQGALFIFVLFIFFVAAIIIMNTLSMAAIERISELGMMRAIGARKFFVGSMFFAETALLAAFFGGLGIVIGMGAVWIVDSMNISTTSNDIVGMLAGGDTLHPIITVGGIVLGVIQLAIATVLAMLYPMRVATKITPLEAITRD